MLNFIKTTNEIMLKEVPYIITSNINYRCENSVMTMTVHFYDLELDKRSFTFKYFEADRPLCGDDPLILYFTNYLNMYVKPIFKKDKPEGVIYADWNIES